MNRRASDWSELPKQLLEAIVKRLKPRAEACNIRAVCKKWQQSIPLSLLHGKPILSPILPRRISAKATSLFSSAKPPGESLILVAASVCLVRPSRDPTKPPWMIAVEEVNHGKLYLRRPMSRVVFKKHPRELPRVLNVSHLHIKEIAKFYYFRFADRRKEMFEEQSLPEYFIKKVVLFKKPLVSSDSATVKDYTAVILYDNGNICAIRLGEMDQNGEISREVVAPISLNEVGKFDDIICFEGELYIVDHNSRVYAIDYDSLELKTIVSDSTTSDITSRRKKWLVESLGVLYLISRANTYTREVEIYRLDAKRQCWVKVENLGEDRLLFVTYDGGFFASVKDFPGWVGNCIVFYKGSFTPLNSISQKPDLDIFTYDRWWGVCDLDIAVYNFSADCKYSARRLSVYGESHTDLFWPPPEWVVQHACSSQRCLKHHEQVRSGRKTVRIKLEEVSPEAQLQIAENPSLEHTNPQHLNDEGREVCRPKDLWDVSISRPSATCSAQKSIAFEELNIRADLLPTLRKIQTKHGDIIGCCPVRNRELLAKALESLAVVVETLKSISPRSLKDCHADYISSTVSDLHFMQLNVKWLAPYVEKALALHRSKPLISKLAAIDIAKTEVQQKRMSLLEEAAKLNEQEKSLEEERICVSEKIPVPGPTDLDGCVGEGLC